MNCLCYLNRLLGLLVWPCAGKISVDVLHEIYQKMFRCSACRLLLLYDGKSACKAWTCHALFFALLLFSLFLCHFVWGATMENRSSASSYCFFKIFPTETTCTSHRICVRFALVKSKCMYVQIYLIWHKFSYLMTEGATMNANFKRKFGPQAWFV